MDQKLQEALQELTQKIDPLTEALEPYFEGDPIPGTRDLRQMGVTEKIKTANFILRTQERALTPTQDHLTTPQKVCEVCGDPLNNLNPGCGVLDNKQMCMSCIGETGRTDFAQAR